MIRLPRFIRYLKCRERLIRYTVKIDLLKRHRILNNYFTMLTEKFPQVYAVSLGSWIRFSVPVSFYKKSKKFREHEAHAIELCKLLGYELIAGWSSGGSDSVDHYYYSVFCGRELYKVQMELEGYYIFSPTQYVVGYYEKLRRLESK